MGDNLCLWFNSVFPITKETVLEVMEHFPDANCPDGALLWATGYTLVIFDIAMEKTNTTFMIFMGSSK
jgi:hypothetical protein